MSHYTLRDAAFRELEEIWFYTYQNWSQAQADDYYNALLDRCVWLATNPKLGKARDDIGKGFFYYPEGRHFIFYEITVHGIEIAGFPHQNMDVVRYFE